MIDYKTVEVDIYEPFLGVGEDELFDALTVIEKMTGEKLKIIADFEMYNYRNSDEVFISVSGLYLLCEFMQQRVYFTDAAIAKINDWMQDPVNTKYMQEIPFRYFDVKEKLGVNL